MAKNLEKNILLISEDIDLHHALKKYCKHLGYNIIFFESGAAGLQYAKSSSMFHLAIISLNLPDIAGYKVISILRKLNITCPMFLTAEKFSQTDYNSFIKFGADTIISSPINFGVLLLEIEAALIKFQPDNDDNYAEIDFPQISMSAQFHFTIRDISETGCRFHSHFPIAIDAIVILCSPEISDKLALSLDTVYPVKVMNCVESQNGKGYELGSMFVALQEKVYTRLHHACRSAKGFKFTTFN